jgi:hypothetical protein
MQYLQNPWRRCRPKKIANTSAALFLLTADHTPLTNNTNFVTSVFPSNDLSFQRNCDFW